MVKSWKKHAYILRVGLGLFPTTARSDTQREAGNLCASDFGMLWDVYEKNIFKHQRCTNGRRWVVRKRYIVEVNYVHVCRQNNSTVRQKFFRLYLEASTIMN